MALHLAGGDLPRHRLIGAEQELLSGLPARVKRPRNLRTAKGPIREQPAVFAREGNALSDAMINDGNADLGETMDVRLAGAEVSSLDGVVKETPDAVTVVLIVFCGVDSALRCDRMRTARTVLIAKGPDVVSEFTKRGGSGSAGEPGADDDQVVLPLVGWVHQLQLG